MILVGYALSTVVKLLLAVARTPIEVLIVRIGDRVGKGIRTSPRGALLSESVSIDRHLMLRNQLTMRPTSDQTICSATHGGVEMCDTVKRYGRYLLV